MLGARNRCIVLQKYPPLQFPCTCPCVQYLPGGQAVQSDIFVKFLSEPKVPKGQINSVPNAVFAGQ